MPPELISILAQLPVVAVFIWYSDKLYKRFMEFLANQRANDRNVIESLTAEVRKIAECTTKDHAIIIERLRADERKNP